MDAAEYSRTTSAPAVFRAAELEATVACLQSIGSPLAQPIGAVPRAPIPRPSLHRGPVDEFFRLQLSFELVSELVQVLLDAEAAAVISDETSNAEALHRASLVDR
jgi:hypothetical protein